MPTGALLGLDAVAAAAEGEVKSVRMTTRKPPIGLKGAPYLERNGISVDGLTEAKRVFSGSARDASEGTDFHAVANGHVSITPLQLDLTHTQMLPAAHDWARAGSGAS